MNGFHYLGYAVTGLPMQAQLVILIGPVVPFYRVAEVFMFVITFFMIAGNAASRQRVASTPEEVTLS